MERKLDATKKIRRIEELFLVAVIVNVGSGWELKGSCIGFLTKA
jgi:hypothetical protein